MIALSEKNHNYFNQGHNSGMLALHNLNINFISQCDEQFKLNLKNNIVNVLDVGCGSGGMASKFIELFIPKSYTCVDFDNFLKPTKERVLFEKVNLNNLSNLDTFIDNNINKYDVIFLFDVLEHVIYFNYIMENINKLLKKDGVVFVGLPVDINFSTKIKMLLFKNIFNPFKSLHGHINLFSFNEIKNEMSNVNSLSLIKLEKTGLGYGMYDKLGFGFLANIFECLVSRVYLLYIKKD